MDNKTYVYKETGEEIAIEIVLSFKVEELNKSFIAYTLNYDGESDTVPIFISEYDGKTIKVQGFYYTLADFDKNFFICGRYMVDGNSTKVAGFMSMYDGVMSLEENEWIEVTGKIIKGNYNGEIPVIKVDTITKIPAPANMYIEQKNSNH